MKRRISEISELFHRKENTGFGARRPLGPGEGLALFNHEILREHAVRDEESRRESKISEKRE